MPTAYSDARTVVVANTDTTLLTAPAGDTVISRITATNIGTTDRTIRVAHVDGAIGVVANEDYITYDSTVRANQPVTLGEGITMDQNDTLLVRASHADIVFKVWYAVVT